jgi:predicted RNase H-like nuclease (RuvC/YqgF family)
MGEAHKLAAAKRKETLEQKRIEDADNAASHNYQRGRPELSGTEKQVRWAEVLRMQALDEMDAALEGLDEILEDRLPEVDEPLRLELAGAMRQVAESIILCSSAAVWIGKQHEWCNRGGVNGVVRFLVGEVCRKNDMIPSWTSELIRIRSEIESIEEQVQRLVASMREPVAGLTKRLIEEEVRVKKLLSEVSFPKPRPILQETNQ